MRHSLPDLYVRPSASFSSGAVRRPSHRTPSDDSSNAHKYKDLLLVSDILASNMALLDAYLTSTYWDHPMIDLRGVALVHLFFASHVNATILLKLATTIELMQASRSFRPATELAFRSDSPAVQVVAEMWRLLFEPQMGPFDDHVVSLLQMYAISPVELDPARVSKLQASVDPDLYCQKSVSTLMRHADSAMSFILKVMDAELERGSGLLVESLFLVLFITSKFVSKTEAVQIVASTLFLRVISPRLVALASKFCDDDEDRPRAMRGAVLLGRIFQCAANGCKDFQWPKLNVLVDVLHSSIMRRITEFCRLNFVMLSKCELPRSVYPLHWEVALSMIRSFVACEETQPLLHEQKIREVLLASQTLNVFEIEEI